MRIKDWKVAVVSSCVILGGLIASAQDKPKQPCIEPTPQQQSMVANYVAKKNHLTSSSDLTPVKNERANDACFWKFEYQTARKAALVVYLSPDRTFLAPDLYDIRVDPLLEDRKHEESVMAGLLAGDPPLMGQPNAPVSLVEFSDFECPYCQKLKEILEKDVLPKASGKVSIAFKNFPLPMHPWAKPAAMMAACAGLQDMPDFWKLHDFLFDNQRNLTADNLTQKVSDFVSTGTSLDKVQFQKCLDKDLTLGVVTKDMTLGQQSGVRATPTVFVNGVKYEGVESADQLLAIINSAANGSSAQITPTPMQLTAKDVPNECVKPSPKPN